MSNDRPPGRFLAPFNWDFPRQRVVRQYRPGRPSNRIIGILVTICVLFGYLAVSLAHLQLMDSSRANRLGAQQRIETVTLPADRGAILDRNGNELAMSLPVSTVWVDPQSVTDPNGEAAALAPVLGIDSKDILPKLTASNRFQYLARQVPDDEAQRVTDLNLAGVSLLRESQRVNPSDLLGANLLGQVDLDGAGLGGLEKKYNDQLTGTSGQLTVEQAPGGATIAPGDQHLTPAQPGDDLVLTIDQSLQYEVESALADQIATMKAKGGMAVVSDPRTGEILAMATLSWDDQQGKAVVNRSNLPLIDVFEPGSANKIITMAAGIQEGLITKDSTELVPDHLRVSDHTFTDHDKHPTKNYTMTDVLATSSNVGTIMLAQKLGKDKIDHYLRAFGFGSKTPLDWPDESPGIMLDPENWSGTSIGSIPIGQGVAVTAVQMLSAYNVLANHGNYVAPKLIKASIDQQGAEHPTDPSETHPVVSANAADQVRDMMAAVVNSGTGTSAAIDGYTVAGKTGTARKPQPTGTYQDAEGHFHYMAAFAGFVPAEDPQLSAIVVLDEPTTSIYAAEAAAPVFSRVMSYALRLYKIPPPAVALQVTPPSAAVTGADDVTGGNLPGDKPVTNAKVKADVTPDTTIPDAQSPPSSVPNSSASTTTSTTAPPGAKPKSGSGNAGSTGASGQTTGGKTTGAAKPTAPPSGSPR